MCFDRSFSLSSPKCVCVHLCAWECKRGRFGMGRKVEHGIFDCFILWLIEYPWQRVCLKGGTEAWSCRGTFPFISPSPFSCFLVPLCIADSLSLCISVSTFKWNLGLQWCDLSFFLSAMNWATEVCYQVRDQKQCEHGCECAPSSIVASFKLEAFLTRAGDLAEQNIQPHHMKNNPVYVKRCTHPHSSSHTHSRLCFQAVFLFFFVGSMADHPDEWMYPHNSRDTISSQVYFSGISAEMCQSDKAEEIGIWFWEIHCPKVKTN